MGMEGFEPPRGYTLFFSPMRSKSIGRHSRPNLFRRPVVTPLSGVGVSHNLSVLGSPERTRCTGVTIRLMPRSGIEPVYTSLMRRSHIHLEQGYQLVWAVSPLGEVRMEGFEPPSLGPKPRRIASYPTFSMKVILRGIPHPRVYYWECLSPT